MKKVVVTMLLIMSVVMVNAQREDLMLRDCNGDTVNFMSFFNTKKIVLVVMIYNYKCGPANRAMREISKRYYDLKKEYGLQFVIVMCGDKEKQQPPKEWNLRYDRFLYAPNDSFINYMGRLIGRTITFPTFFYFPKKVAYCRYSVGFASCDNDIPKKMKVVYDELKKVSEM